jgi:cytidylate kinase
MFQTVTVEREYGAGGSIIAQRVAKTFRWTLLDRALVRIVARAANAATRTLERYDEHVESWCRRFNRNGLRAAAIHAGVPPAEAEPFGGETVASLTRRAILRAARTGNCVIVGRGAQCILRDRQDVLNVSIYSPMRERLPRVHSRIQPTDVGGLIRSMDYERANYIRTYYGCDWKDPHLCHMMISSHIGIENARRMIVDAILRSDGAVAA